MNVYVAALTSLSTNGVEINREHWMKEAMEAEKSGSVHTCQTIIKSIIGQGVEDEDRKDTWMEDAELVSTTRLRVLTESKRGKLKEIS